MARKLLFTGLLLALAAASAGDVSAQTRSPGLPRLEAVPEPPKNLSPSARDRARGIDFLLGALKAAPDDASARHVEARVWAFWSHTSSDTTALLMSRAHAALKAEQVNLAIELLGSVTKLRPDYIEAWNRRAILYYRNDRYADALDDFRQVLVREPRHFGALVGVGMIMNDMGDERRALEAYRKALEINPRLEKVPEMVRILTEKVEGRDI